MGLQQFVTELAALHARAKKGQLTPAERADYERDRDELATALVNAQRIALRPGETPRRALRVGRVLPVEITAPGATNKAITLEISSGGFSINVSTVPPSWTGGVSFKLKLPTGREVAGQALMKLNKPAEACKAYGELDDVYGAKLTGALAARLKQARADARCS